jgi:hypothetical protein
MPTNHCEWLGVSIGDLLVQNSLAVAAKVRFKRVHVRPIQTTAIALIADVVC